MPRDRRNAKPQGAVYVYTPAPDPRTSSSPAMVQRGTFPLQDLDEKLFVRVSSYLSSAELMTTVCARVCIFSVTYALMRVRLSTCRARLVSSHETPGCTSVPWKHENIHVSTRLRAHGSTLPFVDVGMLCSDMDRGSFGPSRRWRVPCSTWRICETLTEEAAPRRAGGSSHPCSSALRTIVVLEPAHSRPRVLDQAFGRGKS